MPRLLSLDAFRGLTIALMILVNTPGDGRHTYAPLQHAAWHGWTLTDCVFPSFVWIVGVAITLSLGRKLDQPRGALYREILKRSAILFGLGLLIYAFPTFPLDTFRILGVLQRIAICYLVAGVIFLNTSVRGQIVTTVGLMAGYWAIMSMGDWSLEGNISHAVDRAVLGAHNYHNTRTWDPEGIVSTLPSIATCLLGIFAGHILRGTGEITGKVVRMLGIGAALIVAGLALDTVMPINKKLWTDSFVLLMAGLDFVVFGALLWLIDGKKVTAPFRPAMVMGMNAIALYLSSEFIEIILDHWHWKEPLYQAVFAPLASPVNASLMYAVTYVLLHLGIAYALYSRRLFFRA